jgi:hypothetical protein
MDHWVVERREPRETGSHTLWLYDGSASAPRKFLEFEWSVDLMWSPDGRALAVTDHAGSSESTALVFTGPRLTQRVDLENSLRASLGALPEIFNNGHRYFEALVWLGTKTLRFRVEAYDSGPGYAGTFRYEVGGRVVREKKR